MSKGASLERKPKRRWRALSLKSMLIAIALFSIGFAWLDYRARKQKESVEWVQSFNRNIAYDYQIRSNGRSDAMPSLNWLADLIGIDYVASVELVNFGNEPIRDISPVANLHALTHFMSHGEQLTDIAPLANLTKLTNLSLSRNPIEDISPLRNVVRGLKGISIFDTRVSDISVLKNVSKLEHVYLMQTGVSDISALSNHQGMKTLSVSKTLVSNLEPISGFTKLTKLDVSHSAVTDISPLFGLTGLTELNLIGTEVSAEQVDQFRRTLPGCKVKFCSVKDGVIRY